MKTKILCCAIVTIASFVGGAAFAQTSSDQTVSSTLPKPTPVQDDAGWRPHVGLQLGIANPEGSYRSTAQYALDVGFQPYIPFGVGASLSTLKAQAMEGDDDLDQTALMLTGTYNFGGTNMILRHSYVGGGVGAVFTASTTEAAIAPMAGFDIPIRQADRSFLSLGANAKYMAINGSEADGLIVSGAMKYWY